MFHSKSVIFPAHMLCRRTAVAFFSNITKKTVSANGVDFHVEMSPGWPDADPVICLPGALGTASTDFGPQLAGGLGAGFQVVSFDPRGYGQSRSVRREFPLDFYEQDADDAVAIMQHLGFDKFSVMGWSDGANSAVILASKYQQEVEKLVIWGGNAYITPEDIKLWENVRDIGNWSERMRTSLQAVYGDELQSLNDRFTDGMIGLMEHRYGNVCLEQMHDVECPTLVLHGALDQMISPEHPQYFAKQIPNASLLEFPSGKHNVHLRYAADFNQQVATFLAPADKEADPNATTKKGYLVGGVDVSNIAYGFMGSKALFSALHTNIFDAVAEAGPEGASFDMIEAGSTTEGERLRTLLTSLVSLKLLNCDSRGKFTNSASAARELVSSSRMYWGDYLKYQVDMLFYSRMDTLHETLVTGSKDQNYEAWFEQDPDAAALYTEAQHNGSLATAYALMKRVDLADTKAFLDVGGGSGAFSIALCRKLPEAKATVLDLPNVIRKADEILLKEKEDVADRITTTAQSAANAWGVPDGAHDVVNMSYLCGSIPVKAFQDLFDNAYKALSPGGKLVVHDFMVDNSRKGPVNTALWALAHVSVNPLGAGLRPALLVKHMRKSGFEAALVQDMIGNLTKVIVAVKPVSK